MPCVEDEWHVFFVCPLYALPRRRLPFSVQNVLVEGHETQGGGCTPRNMASLLRAVLSDPKYETVVDFLTEAMRLRRKFRQRAVTNR